MVSAARRVGAVVAAVALVMSLAVGGLGPISPAVQPAAATHNCGTVDEVINHLTIGIINGEKCSVTTTHYEDAVEQMQAADQAEARSEIHARVNLLQQKNDENLATQINYQNDSNTVVYSKGQSAFVEAVSSGASLSSALDTANQTIEDFYSRRQLGIASAWSSSVISLESMHQLQQNNSLDVNFISFSDDSEGPVADDQPSQRSFVGQPSDDTGLTRFDTVQQSISLANGSSIQTTVPRIQVYSNSQSTWDDRYTTWGLLDSNKTTPKDVPVSRIRVMATANLTSKTALDFSRWTNVYSGISESATRMKDNLEVWGENYYQAVENGEANTSDYIDPSTLAQEYATNHSSTGYYTDAIASLAAAGVETPDLSGTGHMEVEYNGSTHQALVLSQNAPSGGAWETGQTYDTQYIGGAQFLATLDGNLTKMDGTFTINSMEDKDGQSIDSTELERYNYQTVGVEEFKQVQENITALRTEIEQREPTAGPGGGGGDGSVDPVILVALVALAGVAVLGGSSGGGGGINRWR